MMVQQNISESLNQEKIGKEYKVLIEDKIDDTLYIGRTECDADEIDSIVYLETTNDIKIGDFIDVIIENAYEYDLRAIPKDLLNQYN